ncbi:MAG: LytR C-terminal domain-containing protein [Acidobacteriota bacterium]|nr:LytR C-terminal domain-containing protein [Acidobacteriota bacterium]
MSESPTPSRERRTNSAHFQPSAPVMLVLVALLVVGAYAMLRAHSPASATSNTTTSVSAGATTTTSPRTVVKSQVRVQVANGTLVTGLAGTYTHQLLTEGWDVLPATNALGGHPAATEIFYTPGFKKAAQMVASSIQISPSAVQALSGQNVVAGENSDDVIVILGPDAATK